MSGYSVHGIQVNKKVKQLEGEPTKNSKERESERERKKERVEKIRG